MTKFDKLKQHIAREYEKKGMSHEEAEKIGAETAAKIGIDINSCNILRFKILIRRHPDVKTVFGGKIVINMTIFGRYPFFDKFVAIL